MQDASFRAGITTAILSVFIKRYFFVSVLPDVSTQVLNEPRKFFSIGGGSLFAGVVAKCDCSEVSPVGLDCACRVIGLRLQTYLIMLTQGSLCCAVKIPATDDKVL